MRDPERIPKILKRIEQVWKEHPDWRFGQLIENVFGCFRETGRCIFHMEDDIFIKHIEDWFKGRKELQEHLNKATTQK